MAKFITGNELEKAIYDIIWDAEETLLIVSPFIKLDNYFKELFDKHINNPKLHFIVVFGKNEKDISRSLSKSDFEYFKKFLNISIVYVPNLHAKYYGNESTGVITSINLHDYSFKNNIEFGVFSEVTILDTFTSSTDQDAWHTCHQIADENEAVFIKRPVYEKKFLSSILGKSYIKSDVMLDVTEKFYGSKSSNSTSIQLLSAFPDELELGSQYKQRPSREEIENNSIGYCIRSGVQIEFNPQKPYSDKAFKSWLRYSNVDYQESYCHKTGKESFGKTSMRNPIL